MFYGIIKTDIHKKQHKLIAIPPNASILITNKQLRQLILLY